MVIILVAFKLAGTYPKECNAVPVLGVKVGVYLEYEAAELVFIGRYYPAGNGALARYGGNANEGIQHFLHAKVVDGAAKEYRRYFTGQVIRSIQIAIHAFNQLCIFAEGGGVFIAQLFIKETIPDNGRNSIRSFPDPIAREASPN